MEEWQKDYKQASEDRIKLYEVLSEEVSKVMNNLESHGMLGGSEKLPRKENQEIDLTKVRFSEVFIPQLGNLEIER
jgi:hypothetical protein